MFTCSKLPGVMVFVKVEKHSGELDKVSGYLSKISQKGNGKAGI